MILFKFDEKNAKTLKNEEREGFFSIIEKIAELNEEYLSGTSNLNKSQ